MAEYLLSRGYSLVTRRYRGRHGELDLICLDGDTLVFVEVRTKSTPGYVPEESVGPEKAASLQRIGEEYRRRFDDQREYRFDLVAIDRTGLRHHKDFLGGHA